MKAEIGILRKGYDYFHEKFRKRNKNLLTQRLFFTKTIIMKGEAAASIFYDTEKFQRKSATPKRFQKTLFGEGGVQGLDGKAHLHRKELFMKFMTPESIGILENIFRKNWIRSISSWEKQEEVNLFHEAEKVLLRSAAEWANVPLKEEEVTLRTRQMSEMIDSSGAIGLRHYRGRKARKKAEKWIEKIVEDIRNNKTQKSEESIMYAFAMHQDVDGNFLDKKVVAVEILNLLRPIVAIARYIVFAAHALHQNPSSKQRLEKEEMSYQNFVQEVRRFYPFFPFVAARVKESFSWRNTEFPKGRRVLLDLYSTNHDAEKWKDPGQFIPERFEDWKGDPFSFIPQGGGDHYHNHRCAGEWITINLTRAAVEALIHKMEYELPPQDLSISKRRIPAIPKSRMILQSVRSKVLETV